MSKFITAVLFVTLTGNFVYAAEPLELSDSLKAAFAAKLLQENGAKFSKKPEMKASPVCACEQNVMSEQAPKELTPDKDEKIHQ